MIKKIAFYTLLVAVSVSLLFAKTAYAASSIVINEVVVSGAQRTADEDGEDQDWIELYNRTGADIDLSGMFLTDDENDFFGWELPDVSIASGQFLVVFCSGKDRNNPAGNLHTNFKLSPGDPVMLFHEDDGKLDEVTSDQTMSIPEDNAYGRLPNGTGSFTALSMSSPGSANIGPNPDAKFIKINEVVTSNESGIVDEDQEHGDWIELFNTSSTVAVDMEGLHIGDSKDKWTFPSVTIQPNSYLLVWADKKDRVGSELHTNFKISSSGEAITLYNSDGATVEDTVTVPAVLSDNSYGRIPNGTGSFKELVTVTPRAPNEDNVVIEPNQNAKYIKINEVVTSNSGGVTDEDGDDGDWIELFNTSSTTAINMEGLYIGDSGSKWGFPSVVIEPQSYLLVWADEKDKTGDHLHTNFKLGSSGDSVILYNTDGFTVEDRVDVPALAENYSYGRIPNGTGTFKELETKTPGAANQDNIVVAPNANAKYIKINEVVTSNSDGITDEDGDDGDWIELFNTSSTVAVNMDGLYIGDSGKKWVFPAVTLQPQSYLLVWADEKDRDGNNLHTNFKLGSSGDSVFLFNTDGTTVEDTVAVPAIASGHSYGRIPNGTGAFKELENTTPRASNQDNPEEPDPNPNAKYIKINEVVIKSSETEDWIELYNTSGSAIDLEGLYIGDSGNKWQLPSVTIAAHGYVQVWADGIDNQSGLHANFKLGSDGDSVVFYNTDGETVEDSVDVPAMEEDHSYGRIPNGTGSFKELETVTPLASNEDNEVITPNPNAKYIKINEVVTSNKSYDDEDGASGDWIELYNTFGSAIDMEGLYIGDSGSKWVFPSVTIPAHGYVIVWADETDNTDGGLHTNFKLGSSGDTVTLFNTDGETVEDTVNVPEIEEDHSYGRIPNGTGFFKELEKTTPLASNQDNTDITGLITINEVSSDWEDAERLSDSDNTAQDWIELYNTSPDTSVNLQGCKIADSTNTWTFPNVSIAPHQYLIIFASGKDGVNVKTGEMHTNFRLESDGETLRLLNADDVLIQQLVVPAMLSNQSYGRNPNGTGAYQLFTMPTPGSVNDGEDVTAPVTGIEYYDDVWHDSDITITLKATDSDSGIKETYYIINDNPVEAVSVGGLPVISTEGATNTIEYWSVDQAGNEELPHKILTDIKLDKTSPVVYITSPAAVASYDEEKITVEGTVSDDVSGIDSIKIDVDGYTYNATVQDDNSFTVHNVEIVEGTNSITVMGTDMAGNTSQDTATAFLGWLLHLDVPYSEIEEYFSGAACAQMILNYIRDGVGSFVTQQDVYDYGHPFNYEVNSDLNEMDPKAMDYALGHFDPYDSDDSNDQGDAYHAYNFVVKSFAPSDFVPYLRDIIHWMSYPVKIEKWWMNGPLTEQPNVPGAVPAFGTYDHWVIVNGASTDQNPIPEPTTNPRYTPDFTVYGLWLTDPDSNGIGQDLYVTAQDAETYFKPIVSQDKHNGRLVHVAEPPEAQSDANVMIAQPQVTEENLKVMEIVEELQLDTSDMSESEIKKENAKRHLYDAALVVDLEKDGKVGENRIGTELEEDLLRRVFTRGSEPLVELDWKDIVDSSLLSDEKFKDAFNGSQIRGFFRVKRTDAIESDYYLVPFDKYVRGQFLTYAAIIIDAENGSFRQASWVEEPVRFIQISEKKALKLLTEKYSHLKNVPLERAELAWGAPGLSKSQFYPYWRVSFRDNEVYCVTRTGEVTRDA